MLGLPEVEAVGKENEPETALDFLRTLKAKEEGMLKLQRLLESERQKRREERAEASAERQLLHERLQQLEVENQGRLQVLDSEGEQLRGEVAVLTSKLSASEEGARHREADLVERSDGLASDLRRLLKRAEVDSADLLAARARCEALDVELLEVQSVLKASDEVREGLVRDCREQAAELEKVRAELREVQMLERQARDHSQAQYERLTGQCEAMTRQAQDRGREADVLEERNKRLEEALRVKTLEMDKAQQFNEDWRREEAQKTALISEELAAVKKELTAKAVKEAKLQEGAAALEAQIAELKAEEQRLRQELFRVQTLADELQLAVQCGKKREQSLSDAAAAVEERLRAAVSEGESRQTALCTAKERIQTLELDVQGLRRSETLLSEEAKRAKAMEADARQEVSKRLEDKLQETGKHWEERLRDAQQRFEENMRESEQRFQDRLARKEADMVQLQERLGQREQALSSKEQALHEKEEFAMTLKSQVSVAELRQRDLQAQLDAAEDRHAETRQQWSMDRAKLQESLQEVEELTASRSRSAEKGTLTSPRLLLALLDGVRDQEQEAERTASGKHSELLAHKETLTSPRLLQLPTQTQPSSEERWGLEIAALHRSMESLHAVLGISTAPKPMLHEAVFQELHADSTSSIAPVSIALATPPESPEAARPGHGRQQLETPSFTQPTEGRLPEASAPRRPQEVTSRPGAPGAAVVQPPCSASVRTAVRHYAQRHIEHLQRRSLLLDAWQTWAALLQTSELRARLELAVADELRQATECSAREHGLVGALTARFPEPTAAALKRLVLEFRHRIAASLAELLPGHLEPKEARAELAAALERGRRGFGRALHAALFLYQKLRALVPSELQEPLAEPLGNLVPVPFYAMPYKAKHALQRAGSAVRGASRRRTGVPPPPAKPTAGAAAPLRLQAQQAFQLWLSERIEDLEERLPLNASSPMEIPHFMVLVLKVRMEASSRDSTALTARASLASEGSPAKATPLPAPRGAEGEGLDPQLHDRLDLLLTDALTVYMSAWRLMPAGLDQRSEPRLETPHKVKGARRLSSATPPRISLGRSESHGFRELRLGKKDIL